MVLCLVRAGTAEKEAMHVIAKSTLLAFAAKHPEARDKLLSWHKTMKACTAKNLSELKRTFTGVDYVPKKYTVFDIGGNDYRIVTVIFYDAQKVYVRLVGTHSEYDKWTKENRRK